MILDPKSNEHVALTGRDVGFGVHDTSFPIVIELWLEKEN